MAEHRADRRGLDLVAGDTGIALARAAAMLAALPGDELAVWEARERFINVLRSARQGHMQRVGSAPDHQVVIISLNQLTALIARAILERV